MTTIASVVCVAVAVLCAFAGAAEEKPAPEWLATLRGRAAALPEGRREIAGVVLDFDRHGDFSAKDLALVGWRDDMALSELMRPEGELYAVVQALVGDDGARLARRLVERSAAFAVPLRPLPGDSRNPYVSYVPYAKEGGDVMPRTVRSREGWRHAPRALRLTADCVRAVASGFAALGALEPDAEGGFFRGDRSGLDRLYFPAYLGYLLDEKDGGGGLLARVKHAVRLRLGEWPRNGPCGFLFAGILASRNRDAHAFLGEILSDEKAVISDFNLAELVREIPRWTVEGQRRVGLQFGYEPQYNPIGENAILRWLGIDRRNMHVEGYSRIGEAMMMVLTPEWRRRDGVRRGNWFWNYLCLWGYGQYSVEDAAAVMLRMLDDGNRELAYDALYFATRLDNYHWRVKAASRVFANAWFRYDPMLVALAAECLRWKDGMNLRLAPEPVADVRDRNEVALTLAERGAFAEGLLRTMEDMAARGVRTQETTFGWYRHECSTPVGYSLNELAAFAAGLVRRPSVPVGDDGALDAAHERVREAAREWGLKVRLPKQRVDGGLALPGSAMDGFADRLCRLLPLLDETARKKILGDLVLNGSANAEQRAALVWLFGKNAEMAWPFAGGLVFSDEEYQGIESALADADDRTGLFIIVKILQRDPDGIVQSLGRLVADDNPRRRRAGYQLAAIFERKKDGPRSAGRYAACRRAMENGRYAREFAEFMQTARLGPENGYGLYDPARPPTTPAPDDAMRELADRAGAAAVEAGRAEKIGAFIVAVHDLLARNAGREYMSYYDIYRTYNEDVILTAISPGRELFPEARTDDGPERRERLYRHRHTLDDYPLADEFRALARRFDADTVRLAGMIWPNGLGTFNYSAEEALKGSDWLARFQKMAEEIPTPWPRDARIRETARKIAALLSKETPPMTRYPLLRFIAGRLMADGEPGGAALGEWFRIQGRCAMQGARLFADYFNMVYGFMHSPEGRDVRAEFFSAGELVRAWSLRLLPEREFTRLLVDLGVNGFALDELTDPEWRKTNMARVPDLCARVDEIAKRAASLETRRGQLPTRLSNLAGRLRRVEGVRAFADIVAGNAGRRYQWDNEWRSRQRVTAEDTRQVMISHLLRISHPAPDDTPDSLRRALEGRDIPREWLVTAADFAPQWRGLIDEVVHTYR